MTIKEDLKTCFHFHLYWNQLLSFFYCPNTKSLNVCIFAHFTVLCCFPTMPLAHVCLPLWQTEHIYDSECISEHFPTWTRADTGFLIHRHGIQLPWLPTRLMIASPRVTEVSHWCSISLSLSSSHCRKFSVVQTAEPATKPIRSCYSEKWSADCLCRSMKQLGVSPHHKQAALPCRNKQEYIKR